MSVKSKENMIAHESGSYHATGQAVYTDDMPRNELSLEGYVFYSPFAHAKILSYDLSAAKSLAGVHQILTYEDIPGANQMGPVVHDELILAENETTFIGQAIFLIAAETEDIARKAAKLINVEFEELPRILSIEEAIKNKNLLAPERKIESGNVNKGLQQSKHFLEGSLQIGGQEHWYLETQVAYAFPGEGQEMTVFSSTQHPSETQALVAEALGTSKMQVEVQIRRMGGAFGGKETQANHTAIWAALLANAAKRPVKIRLFRDDDQKMTGKRHRYLTNYKVGYDDNGQIQALDLELNTDAGSSTDLTMAVLERAMMHSENSYFIPNIRIIGKAWKTNLPSNTAFRGFGGPQGMAAVENIIDKIARKLQKDSAEVRHLNFYQNDDRNITPYYQNVENNRLSAIWDRLMDSSEYKSRRKNIDSFNKENEFYKKGMALTPVKFGISFTTSFLNQAGALVNIYKDGTVLVNHGGTEMGQGLHTKIQQIAAAELGVNPQRIKVNATNTSKVPNTSATAASAGTDLNGFAVKNAIEKLKWRITGAVLRKFQAEFPDNPSLEEDIAFESDWIFDKKNSERKVKFDNMILTAYLNQVSLSATGFYKTPEVHFDREKGKGKPYHYFAFGMAVTEVLLDTLTGHYENLRTDILHDVGSSINERIDIGQVEGGYVQGVGWCTTEELKWDEKGNLLNHSPDTYKIPNIQDIPNDFRVSLLEGAPNSNTIRKSKAVGEPPLMLCFSCWLAIKDAISAVGDHTMEPDFQLPATNEVILLSIDKIKNQLKHNRLDD